MSTHKKNLQQLNHHAQEALNQALENQLKEVVSEVIEEVCNKNPYGDGIFRSLASNLGKRLVLHSKSNHDLLQNLDKVTKLIVAAIEEESENKGVEVPKIKIKVIGLSIKIPE
jgi:hypothetical protein